MRQRRTALVTAVATLTMVAPAQAAITTLRNTAPLTLTNNAAAATYPSTVTASRLCGTVTRAAVILTGLSHPDTRDLDLMLVSPSGTRVLFMSDAGGAAAGGVTLTFDDGAGAGAVPSGTIATGTYRGTNYGTTTDTFPAPAPSSTGAPAALTALNGGAGNGTWQLFARDDSSAAAGGTLTGGWSLRLATPDCPPLVPGGDPFDDGEGGLDPEEGGGLSPPLSGPGTKLPALSKLKLSPARFKAAKKGGTKVSFTLSRAGSVKFTVERRASGRTSGRKCVARTRSNRRRKACTRWLTVKGSIPINGRAGANSFGFKGKIGSKRLAPGQYRLNGKASAVQRINFTIVR